MSWHMADVWENIAQAIPDKPAIIDAITGLNMRIVPPVSPKYLSMPD